MLKSTTVGCKAKILSLTNRPSSNFTPMCSVLGGTQVPIYLTLAELLRTVQIIAFSKRASFVTHLSHGGENALLKQRIKLETKENNLVLEDVKFFNIKLLYLLIPKETWQKVCL